MKTEKRNVSPGWVGGKGGNLGEFEVNTVPFTRETLTATLDKYADAMLGIVNAQCSIKFLGPVFADRVTTLLEGEKIKQGKEEKQPDFRARTYDRAKALAPTVAAETFDFPALFADFATRERAQGRKVLENFDTIVATIPAKWADYDKAKKAAWAERLGLDIAKEKDGQKVADAIKAAYKAATVVGTGDLL